MSFADSLIKDKRLTIFALTMMMALLTMIIFLATLNLAIPSPKQCFKPDLFIIAPQYFHPEIRERQFYFLGTILLVGSIAMYYSLFRRLAITESLTIKINSIIANLSSAAVLTMIIYFIINTPELLTRKLSPGVLIGSLVALTVSILALKAFSDPNKISKALPGLNVLAWLTMVMAAAFGCFSLRAITNSGIYLDHFNTVFYPVVQVYLGKALLIDFQNQYGLYPHFLEPLFRLSGISVLKFTIVFSIIMLISFWLLYQFLRENLKDRLVAFAGFMTILFWCYLFTRTLSNSHDYFFQYYPLRFIFPVLGLYLIGRYLKNKSSQNYYLISLISIIALYWNFDSGLVILLAWLGLLIWQELVRRDYGQILRHLLTMLVLSVIILSAISLYLFSRYHAWPDYAAYFTYQQAYSTFGLCMMPLPIWHPWLMVYGLYAIGLFQGVQAAIEGRANKNIALVVIMTLFGLGSFVYYQGRSHDLNLLMVAFPAIILLTLYVDQINDYYHKNRSLLIASLGNLVKLFLMTSAVLCLLLLPLTAKIIYQRWSLDNKMLKTNIAYLQANVKAPIETLILSRNSGIYYLALQTACPANIPSPSEFILRKDYDQLANYLHASPKGSIVFYDKNYDNDLVVKELKRVYRLISSGPGGEIKKYEK